MPAFGPISRVELIQCFRRPGFAGPFSGGKHQFMIRGDFTIRVPDPHHGDMTRKPSGGRLRYTSSTSAAQESSPLMSPDGPRRGICHCCFIALSQ